jgi:hypothetical protein
MQSGQQLCDKKYINNNNNYNNNNNNNRNPLQLFIFIYMLTQQPNGQL